MQKYTFTLFLALLSTLSLFAQKTVPPAQVISIDKSNISINAEHRLNIPRPAASIFNRFQANYDAGLHFQKPIAQTPLSFFNDLKTALPVMIKGVIQPSDRNLSKEEQCFEYLEAIKDYIQIEDPKSEFKLHKVSVSEDGIVRLRLYQYFNSIKVKGSEIILHQKDDEIFLFNGRYVPSPQLEQHTPTISEAIAIETVKNDHSKWQTISADQHIFIAHEQIKSELVIYYTKNENQERLAWHITSIPNIAEHWEHFIDAQSGVILEKYNTICQIHGSHCAEAIHKKADAKKIEKHSPIESAFFGPETAQATDLQGINRTINVYEAGGNYYMIDASRTMFNASLSNMPNNPSGTIWSIDAFDTSPENSNFSYDHVVSGNNNWNNPTAVSAHYSGGIAYQYFKNTFSRESINGQGGNIVSFINVAAANGDDMDNAFWNGAAMFYGNGKDAFNAPLAKALDVAGHEMSHGVIQNEANLTYQFESGALNESFADIFGAMIDRDDWKIGEEVANPSIFPTGTMRDMQDPHNGGNSSNFYWQPKHVDEMYIGNQDNGGVHINSGIPNHAYYLFATAIGKDEAELIFYDVLANYLVASSQFIDLRYAVVQATSMKFGTNSDEVDAANNAFNAVGIGEGGGNDYQDDVAVNPGADFIIWSDPDLSTVNNALPNGTFDGTFSNTNHISRPSITDDGSIILFINDQNQIVEVDVDWSTGAILGEFILQSSSIWRNVATSKDGTKLAAITTDNLNEIFVFDFNTQSSRWFELYNPTTAEGVSTGDVQFPDALEWDFSGQFVLYDAQNTISGTSSSIEYWDIGFVKVWNNDTDDFEPFSQVSKLFSGLPENVSIGNPTFSKNSPYIIAFDFIESTPQGVNYEVLGVNTQTGDQGSIFLNSRLGYPSYSIDDSELIFSVINENQPIIGVIGLTPDKLNGNGDAFIFIEDAEWATWFATGNRDLSTSSQELEQDYGISIFPNPVQDLVKIEWTDGMPLNVNYQVYDITGRTLMNGILDGQLTELNVAGLASGTYFLRIFDESRMSVRKVVKH